MTFIPACCRALSPALAILCLLAGFPGLAAGPYPVNMCPADRTANLGCHANDVSIAQVQVVNGVTSCVAGQPVTLQLQAVLSSNASRRFDIGVFVARDGREIMLPSSAGGAADCAVYGVPFTPPPLANLNGNACGDITSGGVATVDLGFVTVLCEPDQSGNLNLPAMVTWQNNQNATCNAPPAAWVESPNPANCNASVGINVPVQVVGRITITKRTDPVGAPDVFAFSATGPGIAPAAFSLSDGQSRILQTGPLTAASQTFTITEQALALWDPTTEIECTTADGGPARFATIDRANRRVTAAMNSANSRLDCVFHNRREASVRIVKNTVGGNGTFQFAGDLSATVTTVAGTGQAVINGLVPGIYRVTEIVPPGWSLTALACADPSGGTAVDLPTATATIDLAPGEQVTCTFTDQVNPATGTIVVNKSATGGDATFPFLAGLPVTSFTMTTAGGTAPPRTFTGLAAGVYSVIELLPAGWGLSSLACVDPTGDTVTIGTTAIIALAAGETVSCTWANQRRASIVVEKIARGGDGTFAFAGSAAFAITTTAGSGQDSAAFSSIPPGVPVTITETVPAGWQLDTAACVDTATNAPAGAAIAGGVQVTPLAGQSLRCTFTDSRLATLTIVERSLPQDPQVFSYTTLGAGLANFTLTDDGVGPNTRTFTNLVPGLAYSVAQAAVAGWLTPLIACSDILAANPADRSSVSLATRTVLPSLQPGENLVCTFVNLRSDPGEIAIAKVTEGGDGTFSFANSGGVAASVDNPLAFTIATTSGSGTRLLVNLLPGTYAITETVPAGWQSPPAVSCSVASGSNTTITPVANGASIALGQTGLVVDSVACTFNNVRQSSITIVEDAQPDSPQVFPYAATGTGVAPAFTLVNDGSPPPAERIAFNGLAAGAYSFTSSVPAGWRLADIACTGTAGAVKDIAAGAVNIALGDGEDATCTFRHVRDGAITVTKNAPGAQPGDTFTFTGPPALSGSIASGQSLAGSFAPGTQSVTEVVPPGWILTNINCIGGTTTYTGATGGATSGFEAGDTTANVTIAAGENSACTFTNTATASIVVVKNTTGGDGIFSFTGAANFQLVTSGGTASNATALANLAPGTYTVRELVPSGWRLTAIACSNGSAVDLATATATVTLAAGERVTCTFADERLGRIRIVKRIRGEQSALFSFSAVPAINGTSAFVLAPLPATGMDEREFTDVPAGTYQVNENGPPPGWRVTGIACVDPTGDTTIAGPINGAIIRLAAGETVECTFDNATLGTITINAVSFLAAGTFAYSAVNVPTASSFQLTTPAPRVAAGTAFNSLAPGLYAFNWQVDPAWTRVYTFCESDSQERHWVIIGPSITVNLPDGENVRCYYLYLAAGSSLPGEGVGVPLLGAWGRILLALLLCGAAWHFSRRR